MILDLQIYCCCFTNRSFDLAASLHADRTESSPPPGFSIWSLLQSLAGTGPLAAKSTSSRSGLNVSLPAWLLYSSSFHVFVLETDLEKTLRGYGHTGDGKR